MTISEDAAPESCVAAGVPSTGGIPAFLRAVASAAEDDRLPFPALLTAIEFYIKFVYVTTTGGGLPYQDPEFLEYLFMGWYVYKMLLEREG